MRFSHTAHMATQIHGAILRLIHEDGFPVSRLAQLAGVSESLVYNWSQGQPVKRAEYLAVLACRLASEYHNYRLLTIQMPAGLRLMRAESEFVANESMEDEVTDGTIALAEAAAAHRGRNPEAIAEARRQLREVEKRMEKEEMALRGDHAG